MSEYSVELFEDLGNDNVNVVYMEEAENLVISETATYYQVNVYEGGRVREFTIEKGGSLTFSGGEGERITVNGGNLSDSEGVSLSDITVQSGSMNLRGIATEVKVEAEGLLRVLGEHASVSGLNAVLGSRIMLEYASSLQGNVTLEGVMISLKASTMNCDSLFLLWNPSVMEAYLGLNGLVGEGVAVRVKTPDEAWYGTRTLNEATFGFAADLSLSIENSAGLSLGRVKADGIPLWGDNCSWLLREVDGCYALDCAGKGMATLSSGEGTLQLELHGDNLTLYQASDEILVEGVVATRKEGTVAEEDGATDLFFVRCQGVWSNKYEARNCLTGETADIEGRNRFGEIVQGSTDPSILVLTDDENGDAFFLDDIYSTQIHTAADCRCARLERVETILCGAGDDIVDLTSDKFQSDLRSVSVHGGDGNDILWGGGDGSVWLFGDAGDDQLCGGLGNDVLSGGAGDDVIFGVGGNDIFAFGFGCGNDSLDVAGCSDFRIWLQEGMAWETSVQQEGTLLRLGETDSVLVVGQTPDALAGKILCGETGTSVFGVDYGMLAQRGAFALASSHQIFA